MPGEAKESGKSSELRIRTREFALRIINLSVRLPRRAETQVIGRQVLRSGTSIGAQYHAGCRSRSDAEFVSKLRGALREAEETNHWLVLLSESGFVKPARLENLLQETDEIIAMLTASVKRVKSRRSPSSAPKEESTECA
ncbi:MAG: four helix bundle protein [Planctomycetota bacterium]